MQLLIPMAGLINKDAELARLIFHELAHQVAFAEGDDVAVRVSEDLDLDMPGAAHELLEVDLVVAEGGQGLVAGGGEELVQIGLGAQILADVGVRKMRVMSNRRKYHAISGFGLEVVEYVN